MFIILICDVFVYHLIYLCKLIFLSISISILLLSQDRILYYSLN